MINFDQILPRLSHTRLIETKLIPDLTGGIKSTSKRYPKWVYQTEDKAGQVKTYDYFMQMLTEKMIKNLCPQVEVANSELGTLISTHFDKIQDAIEPYFHHLEQCENREVSWEQSLYSIYVLASLKCKVEPIAKSEFLTSMSKYRQLFDLLKRTFNTSSNRVLKFGQKIALQDLQVSPQIVTDDTVFSIVATQNFGKSAEATFLRLYAEYAMLKNKGVSIRFLVVILSYQNQVLLYDVSKWNPNNFLKPLLLESSKEQKLQVPVDLTQIVDFDRMLLSLGTHPPSKNGILAQCMLNYIMTSGPRADGTPRPIQMFLRAPQLGRPHDSVTENDIVECTNLIEAMDIHYYTHSPFYINLSAEQKPWHSGDPTWDLNQLSEDLLATKKIGGRGVVVHVGKQGKRSMKDALDQMEQSIHYVLPIASEKCPLLLETPSGQGTETLVTIEEMSAFYSRFSNEVQKSFKVCIDTCHVFAAGYDPLEYLERWADLHGVESIGLIHLNDSKFPKYSKVDRHEQLGEGEIGNRVFLAMEWGYRHDIDMIVEC